MVEDYQVGALALGAVVGFFARLFVSRFDDYSPQTLSALVAVLVGGAVTGFLASEPRAIWYYSMGLFIGALVIYTVIVMANRTYPGVLKSYLQKLP